MPSILDRSVIDELTEIDQEAGRDIARRLASEEGILTGVSGGATVATALNLAKKAPKDSVILAMLPDTGERYLSTYLMEGISDGSDDEWLNSLDK